MKITSVFSIVVCLTVILNFCSAGSLQPSAPPASTMKTLEQIEPRTPITSLPFTITASGSYYLTGNLTSGGNGITVDVNNVTIDLQGFTITGNGVGSGVYMIGRSNVEIRNGTIQNFQDGIKETYSSGRGHRVIDVRVIKNSATGIYLVGYGHTVKGCTVLKNATSGTSGNTGSGIYGGMRSLVAGNVIHDNGTNINGYFYALIVGDGSVVTGNTVNNNGYHAVNKAVGLLTGTCCVVKDNSVFENCLACYSDYTGMSVATGCTVIGNCVYSNGTGSAGSSLNGLIIGANSLADQNVAYNNAGTNFSAGSGSVVSETNKY